MTHSTISVRRDEANPVPAHPRPAHDPSPLVAVLKSPQSWQTSVGLPFFQITGTVVEWDEVRFDVRLMQRVPYEGVSRMRESTPLDPASWQRVLTRVPAAPSQRPRSSVAIAIAWSAGASR